MTDTNERPTWRQAERDAREAARDRFAEAVQSDEDLEAGGDYAHEYADGCEDVIYTYRARAIWQDSSEVQEYEDEAQHFASTRDDGFSIDRAITACVYLALVQAFSEAWQECYNAHDDATCEHCAEVAS